MIGSNALGRCNIGVVLGARHFGDTYVEKWAAFAGEETTRSGHGQNLEYNSPTADAVLQHIRHDETMQAVLRFGRDEEGAIVFAHTSVLRNDLPVVGEGAIVRAHSQSAKAVAKAAIRFRHRSFTIGDLVDDVDCSRRTIRRVLTGFANGGYLERHETKNGIANEYRVHENPGLDDVDIPDVALDGNKADKLAQREYYTWIVQVRMDKAPASFRVRKLEAVLPVPGLVDVGRPFD